MTAGRPDRIYLSAPHVGDEERALLIEAFDSNWIAPIGPHIDLFEQEMAQEVGVNSAVALSSGTAALHLALLLLGVGPGDEVLLSTFTFVATANAVLYVGARPVFVDSDSATWNMDPELLADEIVTRSQRGTLPAAVIVVDLYGQCADYEPILDVCRQYDVPVIEDAAEALGASYGKSGAGSLGDIAVLSFNGNKIITTSGGGMLLSDNTAWIDRARYLSTQARQPAPHYEHVEVGYNYRMSNLLAALGRGQLLHLEERVERRRQINAYYREALEDVPGISFMPEAPYGRSTSWLTCLCIDAERFGADREEVRRSLERKNIEARPTWKPMHLQPSFAAYPVRGGDVSARIFADGLCLPSGSALTDASLERVVRALLVTSTHGA